MASAAPRVVAPPDRFSTMNGWTKAFRKPLAVQSTVQIHRRARSGGNDDPHRPRRVGLRPSEAGDGRQRGSARCEMEKISTGKFHFEPPFTSFDHLIGTCEQHR